VVDDLVRRAARVRTGASTTRFPREILLESSNIAVYILSESCDNLRDISAAEEIRV